MAFSRSERRHHAERLKVKRFKQARQSVFGNSESVLRHARLAVHTPCRCSCHMCANPRRFAGNSLLGKTRQELRHPFE